ncbi:MAG TPA: tetratricopeptide repeat protein, partial [Verrucomicrobiae bacterium]|nr:tetratricopeptide repeat protein [Verrucomicrobiae bacterium]
ICARDKALPNRKKWIQLIQLMATESQTDPRKNFVPRRLPWILAAAMFVVYLLTLNHWVSVLNLNSVAKISGWTWQPEVLGPVTFLVTYPFRWLPAAAVPFALDAFSAVCAALALALLARSAALLPHDRTEAQRLRENSGFSLLTTRGAWLPPLLAVAVCGLQLTFWEGATNWTSEILDLLPFAVVIWLLLEYRLDECEWRLSLAAFVYAAGMAEDWGMVGFFPLFLVALVWLRGFGFLNPRFLGRMIWWGFVGLLFYLLLPILAVATHKMPYTFWQYLKFNLLQSYGVLRTYFNCIAHPQQHIQDFSLFLAYLIPLAMLSIRWKSSTGEVSKLGMSLTSTIFHVLHAAFLVGCIWLCFDPPFSPRQNGFGLMFYYLIALSIGYYSGYLLLIFGKKIARPRFRQSPGLKLMNRCVVGGVWTLAILTLAGLAYRNAPQVLGANGNTLHRYASLVTAKLPATGGYLMGDDPQQLYLVRAALVQEGRGQQFVPLETQSLVAPAYHRYLHREFPERWRLLVTDTQTNTLNPYGLFQLVAMLARTNDFYYLQPSFGYYFERFYLEPHGLVYKMLPLPENTLLPPLPDKKVIAENTEFWTRTATPEMASIKEAVAPTDPNALRSPGERLLARLHIQRESNPMAILAGVYYSRGMDFWAVELQRAGELEQAAKYFDDALNLNPDNVVARINLKFNQDFRAGHPDPVDLSKTTADQFGKYQTWNGVLNANGPFDEPSFCYTIGRNLAEANGFYRQALASFERVRALAPDYLPARLWIGRIYMMTHLPERALDALHDPLTHPEKFSLVETNETELHVLAAAAYFEETNTTRAAELLDTELALHPDDVNLRGAVARSYMTHGLFNKALDLIDLQLKSTPDDASWLYGKGVVCIQLKDYDAAIAALSRALAIQTNFDGAVFARAVANLDCGRLDAARTDYLRLQQNYSNSVQIAYGLGEIARQQHDTNEAIRNYEIYLANANTNNGEFTNVLQRLRELRK